MVDIVALLLRNEHAGKITNCHEIASATRDGKRTKKCGIRKMRKEKGRESKSHVVYMEGDEDEGEFLNY